MPGFQQYPELPGWYQAAGCFVHASTSEQWGLVVNEALAMGVPALVTDRVLAGSVWMRDGWEGLNRLTAGGPAIPDDAVDLFPFSAGQAAFDAMVDVAPAGG